MLGTILLIVLILILLAADLAAQQKLGVLPRRRNRAGIGDCPDSCVDGTDMNLVG
jgi:hypothetical protein